MAPTFLTRTRLVTAVDDRDEPGGTVLPFGIAFDYEGPAGRIHWAVNTGWVPRPVLTDRLLPGRPQERSDVPGADRTIAHEFPKAMGVLALPAGTVEPSEGTPVPGHGDALLAELLTEGAEAVFARLARIYRDVFPDVG